MLSVARTPELNAMLSIRIYAMLGYCECLQGRSSVAVTKINVISCASGPRSGLPLSSRLVDCGVRDVRME